MSLSIKKLFEDITFSPFISKIEYSTTPDSLLLIGKTTLLLKGFGNGDPIEKVFGKGLIEL